MKRINLLSARGLLAVAASLCTTYAAAQGAPSGHEAMVAPGLTTQVARGLYLLRITGCNDCHTPGYAESAGQTPQSAWLTGNPVGFRGPWGTTYPANLRLSMQRLSEAEWLQRARQPMRPPMPWFALRDMSDADLRAVYAAVRHLGPAGESAPAYVAAGTVPSGLYIDFVPHPAQSVQAAK